jgi:hypothetical protein
MKVGLGRLNTAKTESLQVKLQVKNYEGTERPHFPPLRKEAVKNLILILKNNRSAVLSRHEPRKFIQQKPIDAFCEPAADELAGGGCGAVDRRGPSGAKSQTQRYVKSPNPSKPTRDWPPGSLQISARGRQEGHGWPKLRFPIGSLTCNCQRGLPGVILRVSIGANFE